MEFLWGLMWQSLKNCSPTIARNKGFDLLLSGGQDSEMIVECDIRYGYCLHGPFKVTYKWVAFFFLFKAILPTLAATHIERGMLQDFQFRCSLMSTCGYWLGWALLFFCRPWDRSAGLNLLFHIYIIEQPFCGSSVKDLCLTKSQCAIVYTRR